MAGNSLANNAGLLDPFSTANVLIFSIPADGLLAPQHFPVRSASMPESRTRGPHRRKKPLKAGGKSNTAKQDLVGRSMCVLVCVGSGAAS